MAMHREPRELMRQLTTGRISRRAFIARAAALGFSTSAIAGFLAACGAAGTPTSAPAAATTGPTRAAGAGTTPTAAAPAAATTAPARPAAAGASPGASPARAGAAPGGPTTGYQWKSVGARSFKGGDKTFSFADRKVLVSKAGAADLEFWTINLKGPYGEWIESFLKDYETVNQGVKVKWVDVPGAEVAQKYLSAVGANQAPDLANTYEMPRFIDLGALADIAELLPKEDAGDFYDGFWQGLTFNGKTYAFPWYASTGGLVFSRKIMQDAGLDPDKPPKTWDEAITASKTIKDKTGKYGLLMTVGQGELVQILQQEGVSMVTEDRKKAALNTPDAVAICKKWQEFYKGGYLPPEGTTANPRDSNQWYYAGRGAFVPGGPVVIVRRADPAVLTQWDTDVAGSLRGKNGKAIATVQYLVVSARSKNKQAAVDLGAYVTGPGLQVEFITQVPILPSRKSVNADPEFRKNFIDKQASGRDQQALLDRGFQLSLKELDDAILDYNATPTVVGWAQMYDLFKQETNKMFATGQAAETTLTNIEQGWNKILAEKP